MLLLVYSMGSRYLSVFACGALCSSWVLTGESALPAMLTLQQKLAMSQ